MSAASQPPALAHPATSRHALARRWQGWWEARSPASDSVLLSHRNVYILPTRAGLLFGATLLVLLIASINFQLNLGFVLTFLLAGSALVSMHLTHQNLRGLRLHIRPPAAVHAGETAMLGLIVSAAGGSRSARYGIGLKLNAAGDATSSWIDVASGGHAESHVSFIAASRGLHPLPVLSAETRFPLGLFRAWTLWRPAAQLLVYPRLESPAAPLPPAQRGNDGALHARRSETGEADGIRGYRRGDAPKDVLWKKAAQLLDAGGELVSRDRTAAATQQLWLDWQGCAVAAAEQRLSRLAAWVLLADRANLAFGLRLPGLELPPTSGDAHRLACLRALALWQPGAGEARGTSP